MDLWHEKSGDPIPGIDSESDCAAAEAIRLVYDARPEDYGHPLDDFSSTAAYWTTWLRTRGLLKEGAFLVAEDVPPMMIMVKLSRLSHSLKWDSVVDIAGYATTLWRVIIERWRRKKKAA